MLSRKVEQSSDNLEQFLDNLVQNTQNQGIDSVVSGRGAPSNFLAEQMLIGAILLNNEVLEQINDFLTAEHFYEPIHQKIYQAVLDLIESGLSANSVSLQSMLHADSHFKELGEGYLARITTIAVTIVSGYEYAKIIYDLALRRKLISISQKVIEDACNAGIDYTAAQQIEAAESQLFNLAVQGVKGNDFINIKECIGVSLNSIGEAFKYQDRVAGIPTGFVDLDNLLAGLHNSDLIIIAGRPGMGKTTFALNLAVNTAKNLLERSKSGESSELLAVGLFSLEMPAEQLARKLLSMESQVGGGILVSGRMSEDQYDLLRTAGNKINMWPLFIDDSPALSIAAIRTRARRLKRKHNLGVLFVDYLQLLHGVKRLDNRVQEISEITQGLKALAKELSIPIIALSQLSRAVELRQDKRPILADLRESGSIEQDADIVLFIYRNEYYLKGQKPAENEKGYNEWLNNMNQSHNVAELIIAKHRNGPTGNVHLYYNGSQSTFGNLTQDN